MCGQVAAALDGAGEVGVQAAAGDSHVGRCAVQQPGAPQPTQGGKPVPGVPVLIDVQDVGSGGAGGDSHIPAVAAAEPAGDLLLISGGVAETMLGGGDLLAWQAGNTGQLRAA